MFKKTKTSDINLLELIPERNSAWEVEGETVIILHPKFRNKFLAKTLLPRMKKPNWKIKLDDIGSWIWHHCDGKKSVRELGEELKNSFGDRVDPVYDRLALYFRKLEDSQFISFVNIPPEKKI